MHLQVGVLDVERQVEPLALDCVRKRRGDVEIQRVAELIGFGRPAGFDAGREVAGVMAPETGFAQRTEQVAQRFETEKVQTLVGDFESRLLRLSSLSADA